jgi:hypothetical protein
MGFRLSSSAWSGHLTGPLAGFHKPTRGTTSALCQNEPVKDGIKGYEDARSRNKLHSFDLMI